MEPHASRSEAVPDTDTGNVTKDENEITMMTPVSVKGFPLCEAKLTSWASLRSENLLVKELGKSVLF